MFTKFMLLYNFMIKIFNKYQSLYQDKVKDKHFGLLIYFPEKDLKGSQKQDELNLILAKKGGSGTHILYFYLEYTQLFFY